jgi:imidazolonepropionase-like amidohydrolase
MIQRGLSQVFAALAVLLLTACTTPKPRPDSFWIDNLTLIFAGGDKLAASQNVLIVDGKIATITPSQNAKAPARNTLHIDGTGQYLIPGLIDSHVHLGDVPGMVRQHEQNNPALAKAMRAQMPRSYLYYGFTSLIDLNDNNGHVKTWNKAAIRPDAYSCGPALMIANGYPSHFVPEKFRYAAMPNFIDDPRQAAKMPKGFKPQDHSPATAVKRAQKAGAVCIKAFIESGFGPDRGKLPMFTLPRVREIAKAAHEADLPLIVHANAYKAQKMAMDAGADMLAHGLWHWRGVETPPGANMPSDVQALLTTEAAKRTGLQSSIQTLYGEYELFNDRFLDDPALRTVLPAKMIDWYRSDEGGWFREQMRGGKPAPAQNPLDPVLARLHASVSFLAQQNAHFLFGSDTPSGPTYANPPGLNGYRELQDLAAFGLSPAKIFRAVTLDNAKAFGLDDKVGTIEVGKTANLLLLGSNPLESTKAYDDIKLVILHGQRIKRADLLPD